MFYHCHQMVHGLPGQCGQCVHIAAGVVFRLEGVLVQIHDLGQLDLIVLQRIHILNGRDAISNHVQVSRLSAMGL